MVQGPFQTEMITIVLTDKTHHEEHEEHEEEV